MENFIGAILAKVEIMCLALTIFITTAIIIFTSEGFLTTIMLIDVKQEYGKFIGGGFILSGVYIIVSCIYKVYAHYRDKKYNKKYDEMIKNNIDNLTEDDLKVLREFFDFHTDKFKEVIELDRGDPNVLLLESKGLLIRLKEDAIGTLMVGGHRMIAIFPYKMHDELKKRLNEERKRLT